MTGYSDIIAFASDCGIKSAKPFKVSDLEFDFSFRKYCADNYCGQFGISYSCPPECGTPESMKNRTTKFLNGVLFQIGCNVSDLSLSGELMKTRRQLSDATLKVKKYLRENGIECLMIGASGCRICDECELKNRKPCPYPDDRYSCVSAYCINVKDIAEKCGMTYDYDGKTLYFFSAILFNV